MSHPPDDLIAHLNRLTPPPSTHTALDAAFAAGQFAGQRSARVTARWRWATLTLVALLVLPPLFRPVVVRQADPSTAQSAYPSRLTQPPEFSPDAAFVLTRTMNTAYSPAPPRRESNPLPAPRAFQPL